MPKGQPDPNNDLPPEKILAVRAWIAESSAGAPTPFRHRVSVLLRALDLPARKLYAALRRQDPESWGALNRMRLTWYECRDSVLRTVKPGGRSAAARKLGVSPEALTHRAKTLKGANRGRFWGVTLTDQTDEAFDALDEAITEYDTACWPPPRPLQIMQDHADRLGISVDLARRATEYHRPDLFKRYMVVRDRYEAAFTAAIREGASPDDLADWFDVSIQSARYRLRRYRQTKDHRPG
jgi:hypothetical protein